MSGMVPGLHPDRLIRLMKQAIQRCQLDLSGLTVLTEAATGAYVVTPVIAAMAGASRVFAIAKDTRFGSAREAADGTCALAARVGVSNRIEIVDGKTAEILAGVDIVTNSGHVRPISAAVAASMKAGSVVPLMYESWEFRPADLDLEACRKQGILVGGTNERHPAIGVFDFLGIMAVKLLLDGGVCVLGSKVLVVCDNAFSGYIEAGLQSAGANVLVVSQLPEELDSLDAVLVACTPRDEPVLTTEEMRRIAEGSPGAVVAQYFGDLDRKAIGELGIPVCPEREPDKGHMGILVSAIGPEAIVRLQTGGLKVGEVLRRRSIMQGEPDADYVQVL